MPQNHARDDAPLVSRNFRLFFFFFSRKPSPAARTECRGRGGNVKQQWRRLCLFDRREGASRGSREPTLTRPSRASGTCPAAATRRSWVSVVTLRKAGTNKTGVKRTTKEREREREGQRLRGGGHAGERARLRRLTHHRVLPPSPPLPRFGSQHEHVEERDFRGPSLHCGPYGVHLLSGSPPRERAACVLLPAD